MDLKEFSRKNTERQGKDFAPGHVPIELVVCAQEELGEVAATVLGWTGAKKRKAHLTKADTAKEIADCVTYLDLLATSIGYPLDTILPKVFNDVSDRCGSTIKIAVPSEVDVTVKSSDHTESCRNAPAPLRCICGLSSMDGGK